MEKHQCLSHLPSLFVLLHFSPSMLSFHLQIIPLIFLLLSLFSPCLCNKSETLLPMNMNMNMNSREKETLFHIMEAMSSDRKWRVSNPEPCKPGSSWPGLECKPGKDNLLHVTRLDFGVSPNPTCKPTATFPSQIFGLLYLQSIFFFSCFTHTKTRLTIPATIHYSLRQLSLRSNSALEGSIPPQIYSFRSLEILTLSQNRLLGEIPLEISSLTSLIHMDLSYNLLSGTIPKQIGYLRNLVELDLSYNSLLGEIPESVGKMGSLQKLDLSSNSLIGTIPDSIENLSSLAFLALSKNKLKGFLPKGLVKLQNLQYLIMDENPMFMQLPSDLGSLVKLQELSLANCGYLGPIPVSLSQLFNLISLSLQNNRLTGEIPAGFGNLSHIYHLNLRGNSLSGVVPFNSQFLRRMGKNLDLSGNPGLCLNASENYKSMEFGIGYCNTSRSGYLVQPPKKSGAQSGSSCLYNIVVLFWVWTLYHILLCLSL